MLTIEQLKEKVGEWVWEDAHLHSYAKIKKITDTTVELYVSLFNLEFMYIHTFDIKNYGKTWTIYKNKEEAEGKSITLPCKIGDTVYKPDLDSNRILVGKVKKIHYVYEVSLTSNDKDYKEYFMTADCEGRDKNLHWSKQILGFFFYPDKDWNVNVFATLKEAEERLKELQKESKND